MQNTAVGAAALLNNTTGIVQHGHWALLRSVTTRTAHFNTAVGRHSAV